MADSRYWRRPGRRAEARKKFSELMVKLERYRLREGITKRELARRLGTSEDAIHYWLSGQDDRAEGYCERIKEFLRG